MTTRAMKLGEWLFERIGQAGAQHVFGVPGDFNLGLLNLGLKSSVSYVGTCNELNAAYAADAYARLRGLGACITTYAVGELSASNGIAGAFAESVPVVMIVGAPARHFFKERKLLHHTLGDYTMYEKITIASAILDNPDKAVHEIDRVLQRCLYEQKPVYISVPSDVVTWEVEVPTEPFKPLPPGSSDAAALVEAVADIAKCIGQCKKPLLIPGIELVRRSLTTVFRQLVERTKIPFATMMLCKGFLDEDHDRYLGLYSGDRSRPEVKEFVKSSDCVLIFGEKMTDFNTGWNFVRVKNHYYHSVYIHEVIGALLDSLPVFDSPPIEIPVARDNCLHPPLSLNATEGSTKLTSEVFYRKMAATFEANAIVIAETGTALFAAAECRLPAHATFLSQTFYGSIGYTVGACLGACVATREENRPVYLFVGDGSLQVTVQELSTMIRQKLRPYIFVINNDGYTIERCITDNAYNDIQPWKYAQLPVVFGGDEGAVCNTEEALERAIEKFGGEVHRKEGTLKLFEIVLDRMDCNELLKEAGRLMAKNNNIA